MPTVVSVSAKPRRAASAASQAICTGLSRRLVTWHWLEGVLRSRIFCMAIIISTTFMWRSTSHSRAGVMPPASRLMTVLSTWISTSIRAISSGSMAMASSAASKSMA